jgi:ATP-binding cassette subfamily B multidrug efflux pump
MTFVWCRLIDHEYCVADDRQCVYDSGLLKQLVLPVAPAALRVRKPAVYMKPYVVFFLVAPVFEAIEASAELLQPRIMTTTVNACISAGDVGVIWRNGLLMLGVALVGIAGGIGACWFAAKSSQGFGADLRRAVFQKVQSFSFSDLDRFSTSSLVTRLTNDIT